MFGVPDYNNIYKSDITFWINEVELCTYRSRSDYGDRRGNYAIPPWLPNSTQYSMLKKNRFDNTGTKGDHRASMKRKAAVIRFDSKVSEWTKARSIEVSSYRAFVHNE